MARALLFFALSSAVVFSSCWQGITRSVSATILSTRGEVLILEKGTTNFRSLESRANLSVGTVLRTSANAQLNLVLIPGALAQISADSEFRIAELSLTKDGNETGDGVRERRADVALRRGAMIVLFDGFARFTIEAGAVVVNALPDSLFRLDVDEARTRLTVVRGRLYATPQKGEREAVDAGAIREWPSRISSTPVAKEQPNQSDPTEILQIARELQDLAARQRDRLPF